MAKKQGALIASLIRGGTQVKKDRAEMITRGVERLYRRDVEDLEMKVEDLKLAREAHLDMSPSDINKIITASEFDAADFVKKDQDLTMQIRECNIRIEEFKTRIAYLLDGEDEPVAV